MSIHDVSDYNTQTLMFVPTENNSSKTSKKESEDSKGAGTAAGDHTPAS